MDPLTAGSLAGTVIQFVDFTAKLVSSGTQLYKSSELQSNIIAGEAADHIQMLASSALSEIQDYQFKLRQGNISTSQDLSRDGRLLQDLCRKCTAEADTLTELLSKLKVPATTQHRKWRSLAQALSGIWSRKEIDGLMHNLQEYRTQVNSQVLVSLGSRLDLMAVQASDKFQSLAFDNKTIISALLNLQATVSGEFQVQLRTLSVLLNRTESVIADQEHHTRKVMVDVLQQVLDFDEDAVQPTPAQIKGQKERAIRIEVSDEILDSLRFPSMGERFEGVAEAHQKTFEWIFQKPRGASGGEPQRQWSDFNHWLQYGDGLYWINGKPASGKSTMMKFIITHPTTAKSLALWIADSPQSVPLYTASFFFWG
ncbi:hypothetical protein HYALB_00002020 [Hymenoscyphus albidus]|uniref:Nephrocystin 3-like N-terminal domain-containing protein n=1 Tax=Hymenoscyphus albidus TaxID=595503 RepID=A0A9N9LF12_9HELO|nr:hypothetical protein HYALB_00002020 [Hymenoscyphus albidus]